MTPPLSERLGRPPLFMKFTDHFMTSPFQAIHSLIEPSFWHALSKLKLNDLMLDERPFDARAFFQAGRSTGVLSFAFLNEDSLKPVTSSPLVSHFLQYTATFPLKIYLLNTKPAFQSLDRTAILASLASNIIGQITSREWVQNPSALLQSAITIFADLKKWTFIFTPAFPTPIAPGAISVTPDGEFDGEFAEFPNWVFAVGSDGKAVDIAARTTETTFGFIDPSTSDELGWPGQILSFAIAATFGLPQFRLIRLNFKPTKFNVTVTTPLSSDTKFSGWRLNNKKPFLVDLSSTMNPEALFTSASQLNLRLMKWRMAPQLNVDIFRDQRALLIGCGTLGCNVARDLLGWGVRKFTLIDYGRVSFSNPPRQPLFCFADCLDGGRRKSQAAADELKRVCPDVDAVADDFEIPMPGHHVGPTQLSALRESVTKLDGLIQAHDITFLLTDTRESRWLPTVISAARGKVAISIALGYDTFSVVRSGSRVCGCYFCNDVVAPVDTMTDRTLDMQCTVTRPGIAPLASAVGVELWASIVQHKDGRDASGADESVLGIVPHQIRGFIHNWQVLPMTGERFKCCVGCAEAIVEGYARDPTAFVERAVNEPNFLEEASGIAAMKASVVDDACDWVD
jgi:ubiquitin-like modifier-activating enzyme ATG7